MNDCLVLDFAEIGLGDVSRVGGKNASLGELFQYLRPLGVRAVDGFATTAFAFRQFLGGGLREELESILSGLEKDQIECLEAVGAKARKAVLDAPLPSELVREIESAHDRLLHRIGYISPFAVRSSATAEDLPTASFAGQHQTFLNVAGKVDLVRAVHECLASLFTDRAIDYRRRNGFDHFSVALSVGVQPMIRSDQASSGVIFTLDPESGFRDVVLVSGTLGLGESIVQGVVAPDEWTVFKPTMSRGKNAIVARQLGTKQTKLVFNDDYTGIHEEAVAMREQNTFCLRDEEVITLAKWACIIEEHYTMRAGAPRPMDIEWAKDGQTGELFVLQARPETVHSSRTHDLSRSYRLKGNLPEALISGQAVGETIAQGPVRVVLSPADLSKVQSGEVLVAVNTDPDWEPVMKRVAAIVTDQGGRTAHAAIVSREIGIPCVVGTAEGTKVLRNGDMVTVSCAEGSTGRVYPGALSYSVEEFELASVPETKTNVMVNVGDPSRAFSFAQLPNRGVGLARIEFIINHAIGIHPMALCRYPQLRRSEDVASIKSRLKGEDPREYFVRRLSEGIAQIAAAFYPKDVIVRTSDFKTNEYARLLGGEEFEPHEENPMLGFRGASRYYDPRYAEGFALECAALKRVRGEMGFGNVKVMIPFCRTVEEARKVIAAMAKHGLEQGVNGLQIYGMCELPSNVLDADAFLEVFDGYSIGSNDLTQLTMGIDRDSHTVSHLFDERDFAVKSLIAMAIQAAHRAGKPIGICGQAPSDYPEFAAWLVRHGIDSISLNPDSVVRTITNIAQTEFTIDGGPPTMLLN